MLVSWHEWIFRCDNPGCAEEFIFARDCGPKIAKEMAKSKGWTIRRIIENGRVILHDYCPKCGKEAPDESD